MVSNWSKNPVEIRTRESEVSMSTRKQAEELFEKLDKFILFRPAKSIDRPIVKKEKGIVRGTLKYVGIFPKEAYDITTREKFSQDGKALVKRRQTLLKLLLHQQVRQWVQGRLVCPCVCQADPARDHP